jgi:hypothetical protein
VVGFAVGSRGEVPGEETAIREKNNNNTDGLSANHIYLKCIFS